MNQTEMFFETYNKVIENIKNKNCTDIFKKIDSARNIYGSGKVQNNAVKEFKRSILSVGKLVNEFAERLKKKGIKVISICKSGNSTLSKISDISIEFYTHEAVRLDNNLRIFIGAQFFILNEFLLLKYIEHKYSK